LGKSSRGTLFELSFYYSPERRQELMTFITGVIVSTVLWACLILTDRNPYFSMIGKTSRISISPCITPILANYIS
jgi:hypothetical protein